MSASRDLPLPISDATNAKSGAVRSDGRIRAVRMAATATLRSASVTNWKVAKHVEEHREGFERLLARRLQRDRREAGCIEREEEAARPVVARSREDLSVAGERRRVDEADQRGDPQRPGAAGQRRRDSLGKPSST